MKKFKIKITKEQAKDILVRTLKTAIAVSFAAFVGTITASGITDIDTLKLVLYNAGFAALASFITAVLNIGVKIVSNVIDDWTLTTEEIDEAFGGAD